jgi:dATP pyrophosphohydrolase
MDRICHLFSPFSSQQRSVPLRCAAVEQMPKRFNPLARAQSEKQLLVRPAVVQCMRLPIQVEAIIFRRSGNRIEYLLLKRIPERNGFWQPLTGGVEEGETRTEALYREIYEETGVKSVIRTIEDLYHFEFSDPHVNQEYVYGVQISPSEDIVLDKEEHSEYRWCSFHEAMRLLHWKENRKALKRLNAILNHDKNQKLSF